MKRRPDIVFILLDDMGWRDLTCYGSSFYETPVIDQLAKDGMRFTDAYAACPVCSPSRASILSGKYPARLGLTAFIGDRSRGMLAEVPYLDHLPLEEYCLPRALRGSGYHTWHIGKWHLGREPYTPEAHGYEVNIGGCSWGHPKHGYFSPYQNPALTDGPCGEYLTDRLTDEAIKLIESCDEKPFFLSLCHYTVHIPLEAPAELIRKYEAKAAAMGLDRIDPFEAGESFPAVHKKDRLIKRRTVQSDPVYAAMIENLDTNTGRLINALKLTGRLENTIIIFTSDNGGLSTAEGSPTCNSPLAEGKGWTYEGGVREPLIVRWDGHTVPGSLCREPVTSPDFYPTLLEAAGLPLIPGQHKDGVSFLDALHGKTFSRGPIFWHYPHYGNQGGTPAAAVRDGRFKLIHFFEGGHDELYDLSSDAGENRDIAEELPDVRENLGRELEAWLADTGAIIPVPDQQFADWPGRGNGRYRHTASDLT
jgi:arylsulfatase A-like enzyme